MSWPLRGLPCKTIATARPAVLLIRVERCIDVQDAKTCPTNYWAAGESGREGVTKRVKCLPPSLPFLPSFSSPSPLPPRPLFFLYTPPPPPKPPPLKEAQWVGVLLRGEREMKEGRKERREEACLAKLPRTSAMCPYCVHSSLVIVINCD